MDEVPDPASVEGFDPAREHWLRATVFVACAAVVVGLGGLKAERSSYGS
ncbi:MAG TPA: hypothetical protein VN493_20110 [Thermoanaerobaculia bacterium]|nr:hypothetical protein [Thermoanaerobaculia bacterium]